jgi:hypothetical protein
VLGEVDVFCLEELAHPAPQVRGAGFGGTPNRRWQTAVNWPWPTVGGFTGPSSNEQAGSL